MKSEVDLVFEIQSSSYRHLKPEDNKNIKVQIYFAPHERFSKVNIESIANYNNSRNSINIVCLNEKMFTEASFLAISVRLCCCMEVKNIEKQIAKG